MTMVFGSALSRIAERVREAIGRCGSGPNPYGRLLGAVAWKKDRGKWRKYRVVAVSHKGSVAIRKWDAAAGCEWVRKKSVAKGAVRFGGEPGR